MKNNISFISLAELNSLTGKILVALPQNKDPQFQNSLILVHSHDASGTLGIIINRELVGLTLRDLLEQINITVSEKWSDQLIFFGGPVDIRRGQVIHSLDYITPTTDIVNTTIGVTSTLDILKAIAKGSGPTQTIVTLGLTRWQPGQLEKEISQSFWFVTNIDQNMIFNNNLKNKWLDFIQEAGLNPLHISCFEGHA